VLDPCSFIAPDDYPSTSHAKRKSRNVRASKWERIRVGFQVYENLLLYWSYTPFGFGILTLM